MNKKCLLTNQSYINYTILNKDFSTPSNIVETEVYKLCIDFCGDYSCDYFCRPNSIYTYIYNHSYCFINKNDFPLYDIKIEIKMEKYMRLLNQEIKINDKIKDIQNDSYDYYIPFIKPNSQLSISFITEAFKLVKSDYLVSAIKIDFRYFDGKGNYNSASAYYSIFAYYSLKCCFS